MIELQDDYETIRKRALAEASGLAPEVIDELARKQDPGAQAYMVDMIPHIQRHFRELGPRALLSVLDVGAKTAAGTGLLARLHDPDGGQWLKLVCTALDIEPYWAKYALAQWPMLKGYLIQDIFEMEPADPWDIVVSSHTIEHIDDPLPFIQRMRELCRGKVFAYTPYNEQNPIPGHVVVWDDEMIASTEPLETTIITNNGWRTRGDCVLLVWDGLAQ